MKLLETIRFENGLFDNLGFHQLRMNDSRKALFGCEDEIDLFNQIQAWTHEAGKFAGQSVPALTIYQRKGIQKCRIKYAEEIKEIAFTHYTLPEIKSLKIVNNDTIDYSFKYCDRSPLNLLFKKREDCDDILIIRNGLITDTSYANILFYNGKDWITPAKPLLKGTQRAKLLSEERIRTADIRLEDLKYFQFARLVNAMIRFEDTIDIPIDKIKP